MSRVHQAPGPVAIDSHFADDSAAWILSRSSGRWEIGIVPTLLCSEILQRSESDTTSLRSAFLLPRFHYAETLRGP